MKKYRIIYRTGGQEKHRIVYGKDKQDVIEIYTNYDIIAIEEIE